MSTVTSEQLLHTCIRKSISTKTSLNEASEAEACHIVITIEDGLGLRAHIY